MIPRITLNDSPLRRRIDREHHPFGDRVVLVAEVDELARLELASVKESDAAAHEQRVTLGDGAVEKGLAWPRHLDQPRVVLEHRLEDAAAPFASGARPWR
jgi:hypothetical protein